ncbi:ribonuclease H, partial [Trifolium medium]|nr:ribonuclease H [Trifolium medium]
YRTTDVSHIVIAARQKLEVAISWQQPEEGWICLNTDGASRGDTIAGCGGLFRNSNGQWLVVFHEIWVVAMVT